MTLAETLVEPAFHTAPQWVKTYGPDVADVCELAGFPPDPEQQLLLDHTFAFDANGKPAAFEVAAICCRQNLKTGFLKQAALGWLFVTEQRLIVWSAHEFGTAQEAFRDMEQLISGTPALAREVKKIHRGNGDEAIELTNGCRLMFKARTKGGGRGLTGDKVILDEAFALQPAHMGALLPTLSARPDPQVAYGSSAGLASSDVLRGLRDRGRAGSSSRLAYVEWAAPEGCAVISCDHSLGSEGCALDDEDRWLAANPQLGKRISYEHVRSERQAMPPEEFARERLGWWDEPSGEMVIPAAAWDACLDESSRVPAPVSFALDVAPDRSWASIAVAGLNEQGVPHVEVTSTQGGQVMDHRPGTEWVVPRLVELMARWPRATVTLIDRTLVPALLEHRIEVDEIKSTDVAAACGLFYDLATTTRLRHVGQAQLSDALAAARKNVEDGETAWKWGRRRSGSDITPLYAATLALWSHEAKQHVDITQSIW
ncbi:MAG: hypothetical protein NVSMB16_14510 [Acidimicrobiales bacterium]